MCREDASSGLDSWMTSKMLTSATQTWRTWSWMNGLPTSWLRGRMPGEMSSRLPLPMVGAVHCAILYHHTQLSCAYCHVSFLNSHFCLPKVFLWYTRLLRWCALADAWQDVDPSFLGCPPLAQPERIWRMLIAGLGTPGMTASLSYFDSIRRARLPANLVQAQRDFFGSHTYERTDKDGWFHTVWDPRNSAESITSAQYNT